MYAVEVLERVAGNSISRVARRREPATSCFAQPHCARSRRPDRRTDGLADSPWRFHSSLLIRVEETIFKFSQSATDRRRPVTRCASVRLIQGLKVIWSIQSRGMPTSSELLAPCEDS